MLKESKADIFVDPVLHTACALDIKHHCAAITPGRGRRKSLCSPSPIPAPAVSGGLEAALLDVSCAALLHSSTPSPQQRHYPQGLGGARIRLL